jgi:hypothetical protein
VSGYACIHRTVFGHPAFRNDGEAMAFAWMILKAQWRATRVRYKERVIQLQRGQLAVSQRDMANALDRDKAWVERFWKRLKIEAMIEAEVNGGVTVITICNYAKYQENDKADKRGREAPSEAEARQGRGTEQEREEGKKEEEETPSSDGVGTAAPKMPLKAAVDCWNYAAVRCGWQTIAKLSKTREEHLRSRLREHGLDGWKAAIAKAEASEYLAGSTPATWFSFDWLSKPTNFLKVMEGNYDRSRSTPAEAASPTRLAVQRILDRAGR